TFSSRARRAPAVRPAGGRRALVVGEHRPPAARPCVGGTGGYALGEWATSNASPGRSSSCRAATTSRPAPISARTLFPDTRVVLGRNWGQSTFLDSAEKPIPVS